MARQTTYQELCDLQTSGWVIRDLTHVVGGVLVTYENGESLHAIDLGILNDGAEVDRLSKLISRELKMSYQIVRTHFVAIALHLPFDSEIPLPLGGYNHDLFLQPEA